CNVQPNVLSYGRLLYDRTLTPFDRLQLGVVLLGESLIIAYCGLVMLRMSSCLHSSAGYLHLATARLRGTGDRLKMAAYYERVHSRGRFCFAIGSFIRIDKEHLV